MKERGETKFQKFAYGALFAWIFACWIAPYLLPNSLFTNIFSYAPPVLLCLPIFFAWAFILIQTLRRKVNRLDIASGFICLISALILSSFQFRGNASRDRGSIRILTINVEMGNRTVPGLKEYVMDRNVDVILMQEVKGGEQSPAAKLFRDLPGWHMASAGEVAIVSKWPLTNVSQHPLRSLPGRFVLSAKVNTTEPFSVVTTHWSVPQFSKGFKGLNRTITDQIHDYEDTMIMIDKQKSPMILGGDFNNPPRQHLSRLLASKLNDANSEVGSGFGWTYPSNRPIITIDHLFSSPMLVPLFCEVGPSFGSDHCSLYAEYEWSSDYHEG